jgi:thymidylate kinase
LIVLPTVFADHATRQGLDINWCKQPDVGMLTPDLVLFLDLPIEAAEQRGGFGDERYEKRDMQIKVRELFLKLQDPLWQVNTQTCAKVYLERCRSFQSRNTCRIIDANRTMQEIEIDIRQHVLSTLDKIQDKPLKQDLWTDKIDRII